MHPLSNKNVFFVSLGCPKNLVDSEVMLGVLAKAHYKIVTKPEDAGVIVVNTCGFIEPSKRESIDTILEMAEYKKTGNCHTLVMTGCLVQRYANEVVSSIPEVDLFIGTSEYYKIAEHLTARRISPSRALHLTEPVYIHDHLTPRQLSEASATAFLKIAEGCMKRCSFCIIPMMRGDLRSRSVSSLVVEAKNLASNGVKELSLVAQDLSDYGRDLRDGSTLATLLKELVAIDPLRWIRLFYCYPDGLSDAVIELMANEEKICKYIDMPLQHANDIVLKRMNRAITGKKMRGLIEKLRTKIPDISLRTSFIVGFPGETDAQFKELLEFAEWAQLDHVGVFRYSREEGTKSFDLDGAVEPHVIEERGRILESTLQRISEKKAAEQIGTVYDVLIDGVHPETEHLLVGRNHRQAKDIDSQIILNDGFDLNITPVGSYCRAEITETMGADLIGRILQSPQRQSARTTLSPVEPQEHSFLLQ